MLNLLMVTLQYFKEYRTYEQIAADFDIHESTLFLDNKKERKIHLFILSILKKPYRTPAQSEQLNLIHQ